MGQLRLAHGDDRLEERAAPSPRRACRTGGSAPAIRRGSWGSRAAPAAASASSASVAGSTVTSGGRRSPRSTPDSPRASTAPTNRYGFALASTHLTSTLASARAGDEPQRGLPVLASPAAIRRRPALGDQPQIAGDARRTDGQQRRADHRARRRRTPQPRRRARAVRSRRSSDCSPSRHRLVCRWQPLPTPPASSPVRTSSASPRGA